MTMHFWGEYFFLQNTKEHKPVRKIHVELSHLSWADLQDFLTTY